MKWLSELMEFQFFQVGGFALSVYNLVIIIGLVVGGKIVIKIVNLVLKKSISKKKWIQGNKEYIINKMVSYLIYTGCAVVGLQSLGIDLSLLMASSAALFVGLGFGLQQLFNDMISGFVILFEGAVKVGDIIEVGENLGRITQIDIRTSKMKTRDGIIMIIPNSMMVSDRLINWNHSEKHIRSCIKVGVAYGSDTALVKDLLDEVATKNKDVKSELGHKINFANFGDSSLDFELWFWTEKPWLLPGISSDLRFAIDDAFRKNKVTIPFPQRDVHIFNS